ncbi:MAG: T9SS type A sorting domain-containing protein [candidate division WOR-3 bacterium]|nr:T9SS type A sorting domain-containing protein [candidate division WOR-3 bacterium]
MRKLLVIFIPLLIVFAIPKEYLIPIKALPPEVKVDFPKLSETRIIKERTPISLGQQVGRVDTVFFTTYDWQFNSHIWQRIYNDPGRGVHVTGMTSLLASPWADRNMRYNFYDPAIRTWVFGQSGIDAINARAGFGNLDINPLEGAGVIVGHVAGTQNFIPRIAKDIAPGQGLFDYADCQERFLWPPIAVTNNGWIHVCAVESAPGAFRREDLYYIRIRNWPNPDEPVLIAPRRGEPIAPLGNSQGIFASKSSNKVVIYWTEWGVSGTDSGAYRISTDGGETWSEIIPFPFPPIFTPGSETLPELSISSVGGFFDREDRPNFVLCYTPNIRDTGRIIPVEMWHYVPGRNPELTRICRIMPETLAAPVGYNAVFACRPSIGQNLQNGYLYVVWEQFDPLNYEPTTTLLRADIWGTASMNGGLTWLPPKRITEPDLTSKRFPFLAPVVDDMCWIVYMIDLVAGFYVQNQGPMTQNPFVVHQIPRQYLDETGIAEVKGNKLFTLKIYPNPIRNRAYFSLNLEKETKVNIYLTDLSGRVVMNLLNKNLSAGTHNYQFRTPKELKNGLYFLTIKANNSVERYKLIISN